LLPNAAKTFEHEIHSMKIVVFGKSGQVGRELLRALAPVGEIISFNHTQGADFTKPDDLAVTIRSIKPNVIVNAAAYTAVDGAENEPELAHLINVKASEVLAREALNLGAWLIHYSTEYVFDGSGRAPWQEADAPSPLNVYGASKLAGELAIQGSGCRHLIFRTSWVHSARGKNFLKTILALAAEKETLSIVDDQIGAPTGAELLADVTAQAILAALDNNELSGLYHVAAAGEVSWHGYANFVIEFARQQQMKLRVTSVCPIASRDFPAKARRPLNSRLDTRKFRENFNITLPDWQLGVERTMRELLKMPAHQL
jgi:dTDP-4-dehydrorhamnose reductase